MSSYSTQETQALNSPVKVKQFSGSVSILSLNTRHCVVSGTSFPPAGVLSSYNKIWEIFVQYINLHRLIEHGGQMELEGKYTGIVQFVGTVDTSKITDT